MNVVLPVDHQSFSPSVDGLGTADARTDNSNRTAIEPAQQVSQSKQALRDDTAKNNETSKSKSSEDKVDISAQGRQAVEDESVNELSEEEEGQVQELKDRDREVRVHEQAHAAVGGQYAGSPSYEFETGPDGNRYAVGGEVSIDVSEEQNPEDTIQKMQIVRAAALAPAEPSTQDLKVAAQASQKENQARAELGKEQLAPESDDKQTKQAKSYTQAQAYSDIGAVDARPTFSATA